MTWQDKLSDWAVTMDCFQIQQKKNLKIIIREQLPSQLTTANFAINNHTQMSATPFLSSPILSNNSFSTSTSNPIWDSHFLNFNSLKNPNPKFTIFSIQCKNDGVKSADPDHPIGKEPISRSGSSSRNRIAPWMKGPPLILEPNQVSDITKPRNRNNSSNGRDELKIVESLTHKVNEARGRKAMKVILHRIDKLQETHKLEETKKNVDRNDFQFSLGGTEIDKLSKLREKTPWESDEKATEFQFPLGESGEEKVSNFRGKMPWESDEKVVLRKMKKEKVKSEAELRLDGLLLERLRGEAAKMRTWVKVMKAGVTDVVIDRMHSAWSDSELVMLKFDLPLCKNMDRAKEIVETKTAGLVVWTRKDVHVVYRGSNYQPGFRTFTNEDPHIGGGRETSHSYGGKFVNNFLKKSNETSIAEMVGGNDEVAIHGSLFEREADRLLDELGPRFVDWWMQKPLPVDADLLPEVVSGFKLPPRLCPPHARSKISNDDLTYLRKLARPLPTHFVLGRNRKLQGLAAAIIKLWEKCHIAKIAVKWGIQNTDNEQMAYELKSLTGGVLLLRNKFYIILYRGKDFLSCGVASMVAEREQELKHLQTQEEVARVKPVETFYLIDESSANTSTVGTLSEFHDILSECGGGLGEGKREDEVKLEAEKARVEKELRNQERKLHILKVKIGIASKELAKLNSSWSPTEQDVDQEILTEEERTCFWRMGLKMDKTLVLGRRGVFDGVIESMHQHWKHREIVKVVTMQRVLSRIIYTAKLLEAESGGVLISVDKMKEGHAIILFRGRNYRPPIKRLPQNLLTKSEALQRSLAMQRVGSLKFFAHQRQKEVANLKSKLAQLQKGVID